MPAAALLVGLAIFGAAFSGGRAVRPERVDAVEVEIASAEVGRAPVATTVAIARGPEPSRVVTTLPTTTTVATTTTASTVPPVSGVCDPDSTRSARLADGQLFLEGEIPTAAVGEAIVAKAAAVIGPENVINNYTVVPGVAVPDCAPLLVEDQVLFEFGSARLRDGFEPMLGLSVQLMELNPEVEITIVAHTDWIGREAFNQRLSDARASEIYKWMIDQGADPDRLTQIGKGETEPLASNQTEAGRFQNRRAEFQVRGLLAG